MGVSPIWVTCQNRQAIYSTVDPNEFVLSHGGEGLNALYYDGSARWITVGEVTADGGSDGWMSGTHNVYRFEYLGSAPSTHQLHAGNFALWARKFGGLD